MQICDMTGNMFKGISMEKNNSLDLLEVTRCVKSFGLALSAVACILNLLIAKWKKSKTTTYVF